MNSFWIAAYYNHSRILKLLSDNGCERLTKNENGSNALHIAVKRQNLESVQELIAMDFPLNIPKAIGVAPLGIAVSTGNTELIRMLIKGKADINFVSTKPNAGISALSLAFKFKNYEVADILL